MYPKYLMKGNVISNKEERLRMDKMRFVIIGNGKII